MATKKKKTAKKPSSKRPAKKAPAAKARAKRPAPAKKKKVAKIAAKAPNKAKKKAAAPPAKANVKAKAAPKKPAPKRAAPPKKAVKRDDTSRRDGAGHLNRAYAQKLRELSRESTTTDGNADAFIRGHRTGDDLAEELGEEAVGAMTSGEDETENTHNQTVDEEVGGPFVETSGGTEFADGIDASNPEGADREPFPKV